MYILYAFICAVCVCVFISFMGVFYFMCACFICRYFCICIGCVFMRCVIFFFVCWVYNIYVGGVFFFLCNYLITEYMREIKGTVEVDNLGLGEEADIHSCLAIQYTL